MSSGEDRAGSGLREALDMWGDRTVSEFRTHDGGCCRNAARWVVAMDRSFAGSVCVGTGPVWLGEWFEWGPVAWPEFLCRAVAEERLDCGGFAALAGMIFAARGMRTVRVQLVEEFSLETTSMWGSMWVAGGVAPTWMCGSLVYHEACGVVSDDGTIRLWDGEHGHWIDPRVCQGYRSVRAMKVLGGAGEPAVLRWGEHEVEGNRWTRVVDRSS